MDLLPTDEQNEIARAAADVLAKEAPTSELRARVGEPDAVSERAWKAFAAMGLLALGLPESVGGAGCGLAEETLLFREIGRYVAAGPTLSTVLAGHVAVAAGDDDLAGRIASGAARVALLEGEQLRDHAGADLALTVTPHSAGLVEIAALGEVRPFTTIDTGTRLAYVDAADVVPVVHVEGPDVFLRGLVLVAAQLVGIARRCLDMSVEHAKSREQFGRPIGVHQAIKHKCAEMAVLAERAESQLLFAAAVCAAQRRDAEFQARSAKVVAAEAAQRNSALNVQVHGGMGWTSEFDAHFYVERAEVLENTLAGRPENLAALIALEVPQ